MWVRPPPRAPINDMATILDDKFKIIVTPKYTNWWTFSFEFFYQDQPIFNPAIIRSKTFDADEWQSVRLLPMLMQAVECKTDDMSFYWGAWEDEVEVEIKSYMKNLSKDYDGGFDFKVSFGEALFVDGEISYGHQFAGVTLSVERVELQKFIKELSAEMQNIPNVPTDER